ISCHRSHATYFKSEITNPGKAKIIIYPKYVFFYSRSQAIVIIVAIFFISFK
ncbi:unnamed protein product, partial [marine sediment metagenome]